VTGNTKQCDEPLALLARLLIGQLAFYEIGSDSTLDIIFVCRTITVMKITASCDQEHIQLIQPRDRI
jgi:hypothetical protein